MESKGKEKNKKKVSGKGKNKKKVTGKWKKKVPHSHVLIGEKVMMCLIKEEEVEDIDLGKYYRAVGKLEEEEVKKKAKKVVHKGKRGALMWDIGMKELKNT